MASDVNRVWTAPITHQAANLPIANLLTTNMSTGKDPNETSLKREGLETELD